MNLLKIRKIVVLLCFLVFTYMIYDALCNLNQALKGISFDSEKGAMLPSITICPSFYLNGEKMSSFEDYKMLPSILDFLLIKAIRFGSPM